MFEPQVELGKVLIALAPTNLPNGKLDSYQDFVEDLAKTHGYDPQVSIYCLEHDGLPMWEARSELYLIKDHAYAAVWIAGHDLSERIKEIYETAVDVGYRPECFASSSDPVGQYVAAMRQQQKQKLGLSLKKESAKILNFFRR